MSNGLHIFGANDYVSDKTNFNSNESILQKIPNESDFHAHAQTSEILYIFLNCWSDFIDLYVNKKKTLKKNHFLFQFSSLLICLEFGKIYTKGPLACLMLVRR